MKSLTINEDLMIRISCSQRPQSDYRMVLPYGASEKARENFRMGKPYGWIDHPKRI